MLSRIQFSSIPSATPLAIVNQHASAAVLATGTASWRPLLVVVGRGRHGPNAHGKELVKMLATAEQAPSIGVEIRKTVGDVAAAMITSSTQAGSASFLVVQAAAARREDD